MENIWSKNKYVNTTINVLLFLLGINFMHYAQILVPIICLILFVDSKFRFQVNSIKTFIILCLFGISFLIFARKQGLFAVMGLFLPMAYYIGSNVENVNEENIRKIIYIIIFGMMTHVLLNFCLDLTKNGFHIFFTTSHYDIWTMADISETATSINYVFLYGITYYVLFHEKNKIFKMLIIIVFILSSFYCVALGERTIILIFVLCFIFSFILDVFVLKTGKINIKTLKILFLLLLLCIAILAILFFINNRNPYNSVFDMRLFGKFLNNGLKTERFNILLETIKIAPQHLWGNNEISENLGIMPHDLWWDVYDIGGIITFALLVIHTINFVVLSIKVFVNKKIGNDFKLFIYPLLLCILLQVLLEPIMSGSSIFLIVVIIVESLIERVNIYEK